MRNAERRKVSDLEMKYLRSLVGVSQMNGRPGIEKGVGTAIEWIRE